MSPLSKASTVLSCIFVFVVGASDPVRAQWLQDGAVVCNAAGSQDAGYAHPSMVVPDGAGGVIVAWSDNRGGAFPDIYAQRLSPFGVPRWQKNGRPVCATSGSQQLPTIAPDGAGGALIAWQDLRSSSFGDVYVQRVDSTGAMLWTTNGVPVCTASGLQSGLRVVSDGAGGAIVAWLDQRSGTDDVYAQRVSAAGAVQWTANGVVLCAATGAQSRLELVPTAVFGDGAIAVWRDPRTSASGDVFAQRIDNSGTPQWTLNGVGVCTAASSQLTPHAGADGVGGVVVVWEDDRNGNSDIFAQRLNGAGVAQWTADGIAVCTQSSAQRDPRVVGDGAGKSLVCWQDTRNLDSGNIYCQSLNASGSPQWTADGVAVCTAAEIQVFATIIPDGTGGAVLAWQDNRDEITTSDLYVRRVDASGTPQWTANGVAVVTADNNQQFFDIASDGAGGVIAAWADYRTNDNLSDVYAQRILGGGTLAFEAFFDAALADVADLPADEGGYVRLAVTGAAADAGNYPPGVTGYNVWRRVSLSLLAPEIETTGAATPIGTRTTDLASSGGWLLAPDARLAALLARAEHEVVRLGPAIAAAAGFPPGTWESVGFHGATGSASYLLDAPTRADSSGSGAHDEVYVVVVHTGNPAFYSVTAPDSGHSVDNLPPQAPQNPAGVAQSPNTIMISWDDNTEFDLHHYAVYKGADASFVPSSGNRIGTPAASDWTDPAFGLSYYKISAVDRHGNESSFAMLAPSQVTGVGGGIPAVSFFGRVAPNPCTAGAVMHFGLAASGLVSLRIHDAGGRVVRALFSGVLPAGTHDLRWDGRGDRGRPLPGGLYLVRFVGPRIEASRKVVLLE